MMIAMVLLGLLPLAVLPSMLSESQDEDAADLDAQDAADELEEAQSVSLAEYLGDDSSDVADTAQAALSPNDPDAVDDPADTDVDPGSVVAPTDPDLPDEPGGAVDPDTILSPTTDDDSETALAYGDLNATSLTELDDELMLSDDPSGDIQRLILENGDPIITTDGTLHDVDAGEGNDTVVAGDEAVYIDGGPGNDDLSSGQGAGAIDGGMGSDTITGSASDNLYLDGGGGRDLILGGSGDEYIEGGDHSSDSVAQNDTLLGGDGNDTIRGGFGADRLDGGAGDDLVNHLGHAGERSGEEHHEFAWHIDNTADELTGGDGNDTLVFDSADTATGGDGADIFWLYDSGGAAEVTDFEPGQDFLRITLNPHAGYDDPMVEVMTAENGLDAEVMVDGEAVALLTGAAGATMADVYVEMVEDAFPAGR